MKNFSKLAIVAACAALAACGGGTDEANNTDANMDMNAGMTDLNAGINADLNALNADVNATDGLNSTENAIINDVTTNDPDANLANGT